MKRIFYSILPVSIALIFLCVFPLFADNPKPGEYQVYAAVLEHFSPQLRYKTAFVKRYTTLAVSSDHLKLELEHIGDSLAGLRPTTMHDFASKNLSSSYIDSFIPASSDFQFIETSELNNFFLKPDGWDRFCAQHPTFGAIITFSRVGFNEHASQALVFMHSQWDRFQGVGTYYLLNLNDSATWTVIMTVPASASWLNDS